MLVDFLVNLAMILGGLLRTLGSIGGLLFLVLTILYIYENNDDGNLFWFLSAFEDDDFMDADWRKKK